MELTKEQIKRIDDFLQALDFEFVDIRLEMVDHIASEIEENIENIDAFFEEKRLNTHFLKYMLSKRKELKNTYKTQVKTKFWSNFKVILKNIVKQSYKPNNLLLISTLLCIIYFFNLSNFKYVGIVFVSCAFVFSLYASYIMNQSIKKCGKLKVTQTYITILSFVSQIYVVFPETNIFTAFKNYQPIQSYLYLLFFYLIFLIFKVFQENKNTIENRYNYIFN